jgi:hypothetical protein
MARCAAHLGLNEEAAVNYQRVIGLEEKRKNPAMRTAILASLAFVKGRQGNCQEAAAAYAESLEILGRLHPRGHPNIIAVQDDYEDLLRDCR